MGIPWAELATLGPWGLVSVFFLLNFSGILVHKRDVAVWKDLYLRERASREDMQELMGLLRKVLHAIPPVTKDGE